MIATVLVCLTFALVTEGAVYGISVTSHPEGDLQIQRCDADGSTNCIRRGYFKSFVVCAQDPANIENYTYLVRVQRNAGGALTEIHHHMNAAPGYNRQACEYGATATTLRTPDDKCREVLVRFWSIPEGLSSAHVTFMVKTRVIIGHVVVHRTSFQVSNEPVVPTVTTPISEAGTTESATPAETTQTPARDVASLEFRSEVGGRNTWQCSCLRT